MSRYAVGVLGATGVVGQKFLLLLDEHPEFRVVRLGASSQSTGKRYGDVVGWRQHRPLSSALADLIVQECKPENFSDCKLVFSALDSSIAGGIEEAFAAAGIPVFSNAKDHRMDPDVPILIPFVNPAHLNIIPTQIKKRNYPKTGGFIVTNANCSSTGLVIVLKPLITAFGVEKVMIFTMQALSGAGYPGVSALDSVDNVLPFISGEEEKLRYEPRKILGELLDTPEPHFRDAEIEFSAHCNRVNVLEGHTACVSIKLRKAATPEEVESVLKQYRPEFITHSSPTVPIIVSSEKDRPQPRLDRNNGNGFTVTVGRVRKCNILDVKFTFLTHNSIIGAAGGSILNAELARLRGFLK